jgi:hypothetical protein
MNDYLNIQNQKKFLTDPKN